MPGQQPDAAQNGRQTAPSDGQHTAPAPPSVPVRGFRALRPRNASAGQPVVTRAEGACCKAVGSTLRNRRSAGLVKPCGAGDRLRPGMADMGALRDACIGQSSSAEAAF